VKKVISENWQEIVKVVILVFVLSFVSVLVSNWLRTDVIQERVEDLGALGPLVVILYVTVSHVFAPLAGTPGIIVALSVFGPVKAWVYIYIASNLSAAINFYIARKLGRDWVIKLAGKNSISKIDRFVTIMGTRLLVAARLFGFPLYEFISYAAGLTNISFRKYMIITALISPIPGTIMTIYAYNSLSSPWMMASMMGILIGVGALFSWYTVRLYLISQNTK